MVLLFGDWVVLDLFGCLCLCCVEGCCLYVLGGVIEVGIWLNL